MAENFWLNRNVLVTGATGFLGSWLCKALVEQGAEVVALVRDTVPKSWFFASGADSQVSLVHGCLEDYLLLERTVNEYEVRTVFHLAAQTIVPTANRGPLSTFEANIRGTYNLLEACRRAPLIEQVVAASSDKAYGPQTDLPYSEQTPLQGVYPYDVSKSCADLICQSYYQTWGLPVCVTRCGNFFGGGDLNFSRVVPGTIRSVYYGQPVIIRSDGKFVRDYIYIEDAVQAYMFLAQAMARNPEVVGRAFNISYERPMTVLEVVELILEAMEAPGHVVEVYGQDLNEIREQYLAAEEARRQLGWTPVYDMEQGLLATVAWYRAFFRGPGRGGKAGDR